jgi:glycosyltransferase involved in cell wall biosynthesis
MIKIGITNIKKGKLKELNQNSPKGISYKNLKIEPEECHKGFYIFNEKNNLNLIESTSPIITKQNHIQLLDNVIFNFHLPFIDFDRKSKLEFWQKIALQKSCKKIVFTSKAGYHSMNGNWYGKIRNKEINQKCEVVYPAFLPVKDFKKTNHETINLLFKSSSFYRDSGEQLVNAFKKLQKEFDNLKLIILSKHLEIPYKKTLTYTSINHKRIVKEIQTNKDITYLPIENNYYKNADIFIRSTTKDRPAFSLIEPMQYSLPIISTDFFAIPEIIENNKEGLLIPLYNYVLQEKGSQWILSKSLSNYLEKETYKKLKLLIENKQLRLKLGKNAKKKAETRFSYRARNRLMKRIYEKAA